MSRVVYEYSYGDEDVAGTTLLLEEHERNNFTYTVIQYSIDEKSFRNVELVKEYTDIDSVVNDICDRDMYPSKTTTIKFKYTSPINHNGDYKNWVSIKK